MLKLTEIEGNANKATLEAGMESSSCFRLSSSASNTSKNTSQHRDRKLQQKDTTQNPRVLSNRNHRGATEKREKEICSQYMSGKSQKNQNERERGIYNPRKAQRRCTVKAPLTVV